MLLRASAEAFGRALIRLEADGPVLVAGEATLERCRLSLNAEGGDLAGLIAAMGRDTEKARTVLARQA